MLELNLGRVLEIVVEATEDERGARVLLLTIKKRERGEGYLSSLDSSLCTMGSGSHCACSKDGDRYKGSSVSLTKL